MSWKKFGITLSAAFVLAFSAACGDDEEEPPQPLTNVQLCEMKILQGENDGEFCYQYAENLTTSADIVDYAKLNCRPGRSSYDWGVKLLKAVSEERLTIDWEKAHQCLNDARELRKNAPIALVTTKKGEWDALKNGVCKEFFQGNKLEGETCVDHWDCPSGTGCYTLQPWTPGSQKCMKKASAGQPCKTGASGDWMPCDDSSWCEESETGNDVCVALLANGEACESNGDCLSAFCDEGSYTCAEAPALKQIGEACQEASECANDSGCVICRPASDGADSTCQLAGGTNAFCRDWYDCLDDLGCTGGQCGVVDANAACGNVSETDQNLCSPGNTCVPQALCGANASEADCTAAHSDCFWDANNSRCVATSGICSATLPTSGACLYGYACDASATCVAGTCMARAAAGAACTVSGEEPTSAPFCAYGLVCDAGLCKQPCYANSDCASGQFCNGDLDVPTCEPFRANNCTDSAQCADGQYCHDCSALNETECGNNAACAWDADYESCEVSDDTATFNCAPMLDIGQPCITYSQCSSDYCELDPADSAYKCSYEPYGCQDGTNEAAFLTSVFMFGAMIAFGRLRRRRKNQK